jgi:hypothetical protein
VVVRSVNQWGDTLTSREFVVVVTRFVGIGEVDNGIVKAYWNQNSLMVDLVGAVLENPAMQLFDMGGKLVAETVLTSGTINQVHTMLPEGMYIMHIAGNGQSFKVKTVKQ